MADDRWLRRVFKSDKDSSIISHTEYYRKFDLYATVTMGD